jgi:KAP-like P-loop domain-containing protein
MDPSTKPPSNVAEAQSEQAAATRQPGWMTLSVASLHAPEPVAAGELIEELLRGHQDYVGEEVDILARTGDRLTTLGPVRTVGAHLAAVRGRWHAQLAPLISGRHAILGLALDQEVGHQLLRDAVISALLSRWQPGLGTAEEPYRLVWDVLSDSGRALAEEQPLLAAAFGAPAEATVSLPVAVRAMAWSPAGDRLAVLAGDTVYEARLETGVAHPIGAPGAAVSSIGWGGSGVVGLSIDGDRAELLRVRDGGRLGDWDGVTTGVLSGDGSHSWLRLADGVHRWAPPAAPVRMTSPNFSSSEPATPVAVDRTGQHGLLRLSKNSVLVAALPPGSLPGPRVGLDPYWPNDAAPMVGWGPPRSSRCALITFDNRIAVVYAAPDGLDVWRFREPAAATGEARDSMAQMSLCRIATGPGEVGALAVDPTGTRLAVAIDNRIAVWSLAGRRAAAAPVPAYDTDRPDGSEDLLGADRDAQAIAALASARDVRPPLSIGLFGAWGSGKSFVLRQVVDLLKAENRPEGYLRRIKVVEFNAWQYAETNLWASLVDQVLQVIAPVKQPESPPEVTEATSRAEEASRAVRKAAKQVVLAKRELRKAQRRLERRRRQAAWLGASVLVLAAALAVALLLGAGGRLLAAAGVGLALLSAAAGLVGQARKAGEQAADIASAGRSGIATVGRLLGRPEELAVQAKGAEVQRLREAGEQAIEEAKRLTATQQRVTELAREQPLGALLHRLATISDYRDQLSLVTATRDHFLAVDRAIGDARLDPRRTSPLERVVIVIDDLDRCPPEKVVNVLEAVHLLFSFEMFVVLIAVDTRWLEQSLRIRYQQLLGGATSAVPTDYLEKIIQIPLHLRPLNESLARAMIAGLTRVRSAPGHPAAVPEPSGAPQATDGAAPSPSGRPLAATTPRAAPEPLPAEVMQVTAAEAAAMSVVAPLAGTTPRAVKRFVNTYRLLKARADAGRFDEVSGAPDAPLGDHEAVAFLLALVTGHPTVAGQVLTALADAAPGTTVEQALPTDGELDLAAIRAWLAANPRYAKALTDRFTTWASEAARYSFKPSRG